MDIAVVIASNREQCMKQWLAEWEPDLRDARVIVVEDSPQAGFDLGAGYRDLEHLAWEDIDADLGDRSWIIPRRTSAVKSYGFWKAFTEGADAIWTLDDDCYPEEDLRGRYLKEIGDRLSEDRAQDSWWNTLGNSGIGAETMYPRGYPYGIPDQRRPVMIHHGLWSHVPDLDGMTQLDIRVSAAAADDVRVKSVPPGMFPMCGMNLAFRRECPPPCIMLMGHDWRGRRTGSTGSMTSGPACSPSGSVIISGGRSPPGRRRSAHDGIRPAGTRRARQPASGPTSNSGRSPPPALTASYRRRLLRRTRRSVPGRGVLREWRCLLAAARCGDAHLGGTVSLKVLVSGAGGFVGHHLLQHLLVNTDWDIVATDSSAIRGRPTGSARFSTATRTGRTGPSSPTT